MSESWGRIILTPETSSARFHDKVLVVGAGDSVNVSRSSSEEKPDTENAVFDCRVSLFVEVNDLYRGADISHKLWF